MDKSTQEIVAMAMSILAPNLEKLDKMVEEITRDPEKGKGSATIPAQILVALVTLTKHLVTEGFANKTLLADELSATLADLQKERGDAVQHRG